MTVGKTHSGKTTFAEALEKEMSDVSIFQGFQIKKPR
jgi:adenylate kinase family enzyme